MIQPRCWPSTAATLAFDEGNDERFVFRREGGGGAFTATSSRPTGLRTLLIRGGTSSVGLAALANGKMVVVVE